jgi:hypothetical protein
VLVRAGMVLSCIVLAAPLVTGTDDGSLSRAGVVALAALGLSCTPILACAAAGVPAVFGRRLRPGDYVEMGGREGLVREVTLLEVVLEDDNGCLVRLPQLLGLWHPTRVVGPSRPVDVQIVLEAGARPATVEDVIAGAAGGVCDRVQIRLVEVDGAGAHWRISGVPRPGQTAIALADAVLVALQRAGHVPAAGAPMMRRETGRA